MVSPADKITCLGSDDATTCVILVVRSDKTGRYCVAHLDGCRVRSSLAQLLSAFTYAECVFGLSVWLVGALADNDCYALSYKTLRLVLEYLLSRQIPICIRVACVLEVNSVPIGDTHNRPKITGIKSYSQYRLP